MLLHAINAMHFSEIRISSSTLGPERGGRLLAIRHRKVSQSLSTSRYLCVEIVDVPSLCDSGVDDDTAQANIHHMCRSIHDDGLRCG